jgi:citronellol/citronellal dehydrogenase
MNAIKNRYTYVLKSIKKHSFLKPKLTDLSGKTYVISGGTRGVGLSIGKHLASLGANIALLGKTNDPHPKLEGTIHTACDEVLLAGNNNSKAKGIVCDIRKPESIDNAIDSIVDEFGSIDGAVLNASALCLNPTLKQSDKEIDLMTGVNINGTFRVGQRCLKHIKNSDHGNLLLISPPLEMLYEDEWWINHLYYSMSKFNMSLFAKYWDKEFKNIGVNTLWPRTTLNTAPVRNILGGDAMAQISRTPDIMGEAAKHIICADPEICSGKNLIDDEVLSSLDIPLEQYKVNKDLPDKELMPDFFC